MCGGNHGTLVLCDNRRCNAEYHIACLRPRVREVGNPACAFQGPF